VLTADSAETTGLKWVTPAGGGMSLLSTTTISNNASIDITAISQDFTDLIVISSTNIILASSSHLRIRPETDSGVKYNYFKGSNVWQEDTDSYPFGTDTSVTEWSFAMRIYNYANSTSKKIIDYYINRGDGAVQAFGVGITSTTSAIDNIAIQAASGNLTSGVIKVYGV
jgi:hypothetical protein